MRRTLEEIYCRGVRRVGSHGSWEPGSWLWPATTGAFRRGVFHPRGWLDPTQWGYRVVANAPRLENVKSTGVRQLGASGGASISDPLQVVASAGGSLSYAVAGANEVLVLTRAGRWWEVEKIDELLGKIREAIGTWPLHWAVICAVYETSGGVVGVSSRVTSTFDINANAKGVPTIVAVPKAEVRGLLRFVRAAFRETTWLQAAEEPGLEVPPDVRRGLMHTPFFNKGFRVSKKILGLLGRPELVGFEGASLSGTLTGADPLDLLYEPSRAQLSLDEVRSMPLAELFEEVTPELLEEEVEAELALELHKEEIEPALTPATLIEIGVESLHGVSIARADLQRIGEVRILAVDGEEEGEEEEREQTPA